MERRFGWPDSIWRRIQALFCAPKRHLCGRRAHFCINGNFRPRCEPALGRLCVVRCRLSPLPTLLDQPIVCVSGTLAPCLSAGASDCMLQAVGCRKSSCIFNANYEHQRQPRIDLLIGNVRAVGCCRPVYLQQPGTTCRLVCVSGGLARFLRWTVVGCRVVARSVPGI